MDEMYDQTVRTKAQSHKEAVEGLTSLVEDLTRPRVPLMVGYVECATEISDSFPAFMNWN